MKTRIAYVALLAPLLVGGSVGGAPLPPIERPLWTGVPPGAGVASAAEPSYESRGEGASNRRLTGVTRPVLTIYRPPPGVATGASVVICPGGGYSGLAIDKEGHDIARWLAERGVAGVVLPYRCGGDADRQPVPLLDAQRALRTVRTLGD